MPRAQKHPAQLRHSLEKLRLDVALKRARLETAQRIARKPIPLDERPRPTSPEIEAVKAEALAAQKELQLVYAKSRLAFTRKTLAKEIAKLEERYPAPDLKTTH